MAELKEVSQGYFNGLKEAMQYMYETGAAAQRAANEGDIAKADKQRELKEIDGEKYLWSDDEETWVRFDPGVPDDDPFPTELKFFTLSGLVSYINENHEGLIPEDGRKVMVQVVNERYVVLLTQPSNNSGKRYSIARVEANTPYVEFGTYMDIDSFNTMLLSKFVETEARKLLFTVVKNMTKEQSANVTDDGVGQVVTVKQGVSMASNVTFQNPVPLCPRRTFSEVIQPESNFTLRVNDDAKVALFESDGGAWRNEAVAAIATYLDDNITNPNVIVIA